MTDIVRDNLSPSPIGNMMMSAQTIVLEIEHSGIYGGSLDIIVYCIQVYIKEIQVIT